MLPALLLPSLAHAHPLGNNTVNRQAAITVAADRVSIRYRLDLAEIPALIAAQEADADGDGDTTDSEWDAWARRRGDAIRDGIALAVAGKPLPLALDATRWQRVPGAAGLATLRVEAQLFAPLRAMHTARIEYRDLRRPDEAGWKEVIATASHGARLVDTDVPRRSPSHDLTAYPAPDTSVPAVLSARIQAEWVAPAPRRWRARATVAGDAAKSDPSAAAPGWVAAPTSHVSMFAQIGAFFRLGVHHIATGWDHLVFLLGLVIAQKSLRRLAWVITAFTIAHSLTLGLVASGLVSPPGDWVESAIALTIAYVGLANLVGRLRHGAAVAFAFGLVHGFGFAGALAESLEHTPVGGNGWLFDLAAFNLGIEAFQLSLILALVPIMRLAARRAWSMLVDRAASIGVLGAGLAWFLARV